VTEVHEKSPTRSGARKIVHVHQQKIRKGEPAIIVRTHKGSSHFSQVDIQGGCTVVHAEEPDSCGARVWISTTAPIVGDGEHLFL
jgi:hypothetical protein